jgi:hypothetical protein
MTRSSKTLCSNFGSATAAYGAGWSREALLSYLPAFFAAGIARVVASIAILTIRKQSAEAILTTPAESRARDQARPRK